MSDKGKIDRLLAIASDVTQLQKVERVAAEKLRKFDGEVYPADGCAITLSILLQDAGIAVPDTFQAIALGDVLRKRNWTMVELGNQMAGDVGSTCQAKPHHGQDHIYLVLKVVNADEMLIADNQEPRPHVRYASGNGGKSSTRFFLRAPK